MESLACGGPWILGKIHRGLSTWRALSQAETASYGGSSIRKLFGCAVTMFSASDAAVPSFVPRRDEVAGQGADTQCSGSLFQQQLLTWSKVSLLQAGVNAYL